MPLIIAKKRNGSRRVFDNGLRRCKPELVKLDCGETIKQGCGGLGLVPVEAGWRCVYCGNFIYRSAPAQETLWVHFKLAREYWRATNLGGMDYINGIPIFGHAESLPGFMLADLVELQPPRWFDFYISYGEEEFAKYLATLKEYQKR